ncbi:MAG: hypothetical protein HFG56_10575 [Lachnospiraceae bacterium]|jgi:hypothetical protein|nr:hypothetical protein [Lachnospiraceae bacterium]MCI9283707.1 hypothetical protein [Lachnospiraceae bacterium]
MNVNDPYDCQMDFDEKEVFLTMFPGVPDKVFDDNGFNTTEVMKNFVEWVKLEQEQKKNSQSYGVRTVKMVCLA